MSTQDIKSASFPWVSPYIIVRDVDRAANFYNRAFGFEVQQIVTSEEGISMHAEMCYKNQIIMLGKEGGYGGTSRSPLSSGVPSPISLYLYTENVDDFYRNALAHQAQDIGEPEDMFWGDRMCRLQDPDNYIWSFATSLDNMQPE